MAKKKKQTIGYKYFASGHFVLCHGPIDAITKISFQDKDAYLNEENANKTIYINKPSLFGGDEQSGGVQGNIELLFGHANQQKSSTLQRICAKISNAFGGLISSYRGVCSVVFDNVYIGTAPNMPDSKWRVKRIHTRHDGIKQWYDEKAEIRKIYTSGFEEGELLPPPLGLSISKLLIINNESIVSGFEAATASGDGVVFFGYSWSIGGNGPFDDAGSLESRMLLPPGRYIGTVKVKWHYDGAGPIVTGGIYSHTDGQFVVYKIDITSPHDEPVIFEIKMNGTNVQGLGWTDLILKRHYTKYGAASGDINPAHIIRECLTNSIWGIGVSELSIDDVSFKNAADVLFNEGMGMSIKWTDSTAISEFVDTVKQHINAQLYLDRITNKWKLYLIRDDYDQETLITVDEGVIQDLEFERRTLAECVNTVTVTYYDRERGKESTVPADDIARIAQQGGVIPQHIEYLGFSNSDIASRVAYRELKTLSSTLASVSFNISEALSNDWHIGMPFKLSDSNYGLDEAIMRVTAIKFGNGINNTVYVEAVEDSFSSPAQAVVEYVPPIVSDSAAKDAKAIVFEVPFIELVEQYGQDEINAKLLAENDLGFVGMAAIRPNNLHINASLYSDSGAGFDEESNLDFCPNATLKTEISYIDSTFEVENIAEFELLEVNNRLQLNDELLAFVSFDSATNLLTVKRGCFDTVPQNHAADSVLYGWDNYSGLDSTEYLSGETVNLKALTLTGSDSLSLSEATSHSVTLGSRAIRPYPPANVQINGEYFPAEISGDLVLTWVDRNRQQQTGGSILGWYEGGVTLESDVTYVVELYDADDALISSTNVGAVNTATVDYSTVTTATCTVKLHSIKNGYASYQAFEHELIVSFNPPHNLSGTWNGTTQAVDLTWDFDE